MAKKKSKHGVLKLGLGLSTAAVATVASAYFIYKKSSPKTKAKMRGWALKMRGEVLEQLEELKEVNEKIYNVVIDEVSKRYIQAQHIDLKDIDLEQVRALLAEVVRKCPDAEMVLRGGLEPPRLSAYAPQAYVSTNSTT